MLPNISSPLLVEFGLRLTYSIGLIAAVSFLGFGLQPPAADWGLMINENRIGLTLQPWAVVLPVAAIGLLTVGMNLVTDGIARAAIGLGGRGRAMNAPAVEVTGLRVELAGSRQDIVDEVSLSIGAGEVLGLVGEWGSGKTTVGLALLGHCRRGARIARGAVPIGGQDILAADASALRAARGRIVAYIPQDPGTALNPALRVGVQLEEMLRAHLPRLDAGQRRAHGSRKCWPRCGCRRQPKCCTGSRTSSPAASSSGSRWRWPSPAGRG